MTPQASGPSGNDVEGLLPCPFCGERAHTYSDPGVRHDFIECGGCGVVMHGDGWGLDDCRKLASEWNRRAASSLQAQQVVKPVAAAIVNRHGEAVKLLWREALNDPTHEDADVLNPAGAPHQTVPLYAAPSPSNEEDIEGIAHDELLGITEYLLAQADIDTPADDEPACDDLCGKGVCVAVGCVVSKYRRVRSLKEPRQ